MRRLGFKYDEQACVGCGYCCLKAMCATGIEHLGRAERRCPFLVWTGNLYRCQLVIDGKADMFTGYGCTSNLNTWRRDVKFRG